MKTLILSNLYPPHVLGGYEILCGQVCDELRARGHEVHVLTSDHGSGESTPGVERSLQLETPFDRPAERRRARRRAVARHNAAVTRAAIERTRPDRVFVWSQLRLTLGAALAAEASGVPVLYTLNDEHLVGYLPTPPGLRPRRLAGWLIDRWLLPELTTNGLRLDRTTCISATLRKNLVARGVPVASSEVIHQGIPIERFPPRADRPTDAATMSFLYVGQLHDYKGVHTLLEAAKLVADRRGPAALRVTVVGDGPEAYVARLRQLAAASDVEVAMPGRLPHHELHDLYCRHDALVFPSIWEEPFGLTHLEAMACGLPVVSTTRGGPGEFLRHGDNALVFEAGDAGDLAARLEALIDHPELAERLARSGRETVEQRFTLARYVTDLERFLAEAA